MSLQTLFEDESDTYKISDVGNNEWKSFALYSVRERAIASLIDGLKPVQRFYLYSSIMNTEKEFDKVSAVGGVLSKYGYNHADTSGSSTGQLMASTWYNNVCLIEGRGSFGSRLVQKAGAFRYTYTRLHENFSRFIKDIERSPKHKDPEVKIPSFYVPVIPLIMVNGAKGVATGFATDILSRSVEDVTKACEEYIKTGDIKNRIPISFPYYNGKFEYDEEQNKYYSYGNITRKSKTVLIIDEVPIGYDREGYIKVLDKLEDDGEIVSYTDLCDKKGFNFEVKLKGSTSANWTDEKIIEKFKLVKSYTENINVIDQNGELIHFDDPNELIKAFCDFRKTILEERISDSIKQCIESVRWSNVKMQFIKAILDNKIIFKGKKKTEIAKDIMSHTDAIKEDIDRLLAISLLSLTHENVNNLSKKIGEEEKALKYWENTTPNKQFLEDLQNLGSK